MDGNASKPRPTNIDSHTLGSTEERTRANEMYLRFGPPPPLIEWIYWLALPGIPAFSISGGGILDEFLNYFADGSSEIY